MVVTQFDEFKTQLCIETHDFISGWTESQRVGLVSGPYSNSTAWACCVVETARKSSSLYGLVQTATQLPHDGVYTALDRAQRAATACQWEVVTFFSRITQI